MNFISGDFLSCLCVSVCTNLSPALIAFHHDALSWMLLRISESSCSVRAAAFTSRAVRALRCMPPLGCAAAPSGCSGLPWVYKKGSP